MERTLTGPSMRSAIWAKIGQNLVASIVIGGSVAAGIALAVLAGPAQLINSIVTGGMWALMSVGLALVFGVMNIPHFAHGESFMVGAYVAYFVFTPLHKYLKTNPNAFLSTMAPFIAILAATLVGFVLGVIIEKLIFYPLRRRTRAQWVMNTFLITVGISFIMTNGATLVLGPNFRGIPRYWDVDPIKFLGVRIAFDRIVAFAIAIVTIAAFWFFLHSTQTGRAIRAVAQDEDGAQMVGIDLNFIHSLTFGLATAMAALAGASLLFMFQAYPTVGLKPLYFAWYVVMLVGLGNIGGAIIGGFIVALLQTATQQFIGIAWEDVIPTIVMILVLLLAPSGIFGSEVKGVHEQ
ncbi:MAG TPA: branched-chain amino acid ABC transporter permease [Chloroflexi bacterium]|nr:branched-chain amino acid ABC transporter permease [Chloroflexota bacterium]